MPKVTRGTMFEFRLRDHDPNDDTVEFDVFDPDGISILQIIATLTEAPGNVLVLENFIVYGRGSGSVGPLLRRVARDFLDAFGYDDVHVHGTRRASGAGPGRIPRPVRFR